MMTLVTVLGALGFVCLSLVSLGVATAPWGIAALLIGFT
jgi:hypothetical protein